MRAYRTGDADEYLRLMQCAGFGDWNREKLQKARDACLPGGFLVVVHLDDRKLVATAMAMYSPLPLHPGGELGWVAADPEHRGKGLGYCICAAATKRLLDADYIHIYLRTDDFRLAAIKVYLSLGWTPFLFAPGMEARWRNVCRQLAWDFDRLPVVSVPFPPESTRNNSHGAQSVI